MSHSIYFLCYAVFTTVSAIIIFWAQLSRYKKEGTPFNFTILKLVVGISLAMWTGAAQTIYFYDITPDTAAWAAFALGITLSVFVVWQSDHLLKRIQEDGKLINALSTHDSLTGLWNLRIFHEYLESEIERSSRIEQPVSLVMFHFDNLTEINKTYGYRGGDMVLRELGERLSKTLRTNDRLCRYKSSAFSLVLPNTGIEGVQQLVKRLTGILALPLKIENDATPTVAWSIGVAAYTECKFPQEADEDALLIVRATKALETAQEKGGNSIYLFENDECRPVVFEEAAKVE